MDHLIAAINVNLNAEIDQLKHDAHDATTTTSMLDQKCGASFTDLIFSSATTTPSPGNGETTAPPAAEPTAPPTEPPKSPEGGDKVFRSRRYA